MSQNQRMSGVGAPELLIILVVFLLTALPIWGIMDAALHPDQAWTAADQNKLVWIVVQVVLWTIGTVAYLIIVRPKLKAQTQTPGV